MMMGMGMQIFMDEEDKVETTGFYGSYECKHCGERHASDDQETWCSIKKNKKE
jgi:uncharacterized radical SAM superfamily protein